MEQRRSVQAPWATQRADLGIAPPAPVAARREGGSLGLALAAGALVALVGAFVWASTVIATRYDIGPFAWFIGAATGWTVLRISGKPVDGATRLLTGLMAGVGIIVGKYVVYVHDVKHILGTALAQRGISVGYFDTRLMGIFIRHSDTIVRPIYILWFLLALWGAVRTAGGGRALPRRRRTRSA